MRAAGLQQLAESSANILQERVDSQVICLLIAHFSAVDILLRIRFCKTAADGLSTSSQQQYFQNNTSPQNNAFTVELMHLLCRNYNSIMCLHTDVINETATHFAKQLKAQLTAHYRKGHILN
jgi:glutaredoxin 2